MRMRRSREVQAQLIRKVTEAEDSRQSLESEQGQKQESVRFGRTSAVQYETDCDWLCVLEYASNT